MLDGRGVHHSSRADLESGRLGRVYAATLKLSSKNYEYVHVSVHYRDSSRRDMLLEHVGVTALTVEHVRKGKFMAIVNKSSQKYSETYISSSC